MLIFSTQSELSLGILCVEQILHQKVYSMEIFCTDRSEAKCQKPGDTAFSCHPFPN